MNRVLPWMLACASVLMTACASIENDGYDFNDGWRRAKVMEIGSANTVMRTTSKDCRLELGKDARFVHYAVASYSVGGRSTIRAQQVAAVPNDLDLAIGEQVHVNVRDCTQPLRRVEAKKEKP
ncbi:hypothetical protein [Aquabacterium sp.]|uniref:hypothetical protein n=1 Tax=Aquabacterium sp. TaxID=1872578 RepID=UPI0035AF2C9E